MDKTTLKIDWRIFDGRGIFLRIFQFKKKFFLKKLENKKIE